MAEMLKKIGKCDKNVSFLQKISVRQIILLTVMANEKTAKLIIKYSDIQRFLNEVP